MLQVPVAQGEGAEPSSIRLPFAQRVLHLPDQVRQDLAEFLRELAYDARRVPKQSGEATRLRWPPIGKPSASMPCTYTVSSAGEHPRLSAGLACVPLERIA